MRKIDEIIVHCSATKEGWLSGKSPQEKVQEIRRWHVKDNGWNDIGYHYVIDRDGTVVKGRSDEVSGAHVAGKNANSIGICLIGGYGTRPTDLFHDNFTKEQDKSLRDLIDTLSKKYSVSKVTGHNQYANKACPGFQVGDWLKDSYKGSDKDSNIVPTKTSNGYNILGSILETLRKIFKNP